MPKLAANMPPAIVEPIMIFFAFMVEMVLVILIIQL